MGAVLSEQVVRLDAAAAKTFDAFLSKRETAKKGRRAGEEADALKEQLVEAMGTCSIAELPDGRRLQKVHKQAHRKAQKAYDYEWVELGLLP